MKLQSKQSNLEMTLLYTVVENSAKQNFTISRKEYCDLYVDVLHSTF